MPSTSSTQQQARHKANRLRPSVENLPWLSERMSFSSSSSSNNNHRAAAMTTVRPLHIVFLHLDLGIGGAEQLVLQLATASQSLGHHVDLVTTRCDPHHCFAAVAPGGPLHANLHVWGRWIPQDVLGGKARTLCSTLRLLYLAYRVARKKSPDVIVVDVLSTPLPLLQFTDSALLFYCHFPDQLLKQKNGQQKQVGSLARQWYQTVMNQLETRTMKSADLICVNSNFTKQIVLETFPGLLEHHHNYLPVLYPALEEPTEPQQPNTRQQKEYMIVSLNRFERKKNLGLLLHAVAWIRDQYPRLKLPKVIIAGGYDVKCVENVEYRAELGQLAEQLQLTPVVEFQLSISDDQRRTLLATALAVVYTPAREHFGIVPLEAMFAGTPVVAVNSGGPKETIVDGVTGFLCDDTPEAFGRALVQLLQDPEQAAAMGRAGRDHVQATFGTQRLVREWKRLVEETVTLGRQRLQRAGQYRLARSVWYLVDALMTLFLCLVLTYLLRWLGVLEPSASLWGSVRQMVQRGRGDEL